MFLYKITRKKFSVSRKYKWLYKWERLQEAKKDVQVRRCTVLIGNRT